MAVRKKKNKYGLSKKEQETTTAFKILSAENDSLKKSLEKTQDELERMREEKFSHEKKNNILEYQLKNVFWIELIKFLASAGIGISGNYLLSNNINLALSWGIPSILIFIVVLVVSYKR